MSTHMTPRSGGRSDRTPLNCAVTMRRRRHQAFVVISRPRHVVCSIPAAHKSPTLEQGMPPPLSHHHRTQTCSPPQSSSPSRRSQSPKSASTPWATRPSASWLRATRTTGCASSGCEFYPFSRVVALAPNLTEARTAQARPTSTGSSRAGPRTSNRPTRTTTARAPRPELVRAPPQS